MQVCDACRRRKLKCDRSLPCSKCRAGLLRCTYDYKPRRTGPKAKTSQNGTPASRTWASPLQSVTSKRPRSRDDSTPLTASTTTHESSLACSSQAACATCFPAPRRLPSQFLRRHVNLFIRHMFPIWPVIRADDTLADCSDPETLEASKYCSLAGLCAAVSVQLNIDGSKNDLKLAEQADDMHEQPPPPSHTSEFLLAEVQRTRRMIDIAAEPNLDALMTSCFLFSAYANLERHNEAWFYLSQSVSLALSLRLHDEDAYATLALYDAQHRRRIFWLLFVLERAYSLHAKKPVILRPSIGKPDGIVPEDGTPVNGFLNIISIFEALPPELYNWLATPFSDTPQSPNFMTTCYWDLSLAAFRTDGVDEPQLVDASITRHWLRTYLWHITFKSYVERGLFVALPLPVDVPVVAGKEIMNTITGASQVSMEVHGVGMERKLCDMGDYILDLAGSLPMAVERPAVGDINPKELLWGILVCLTKMRGAARSCLLPVLMDRSKDLLGFDTLRANPPVDPAEEQDKAVQLGMQTDRGLVFRNLQVYD